ncbi:uncharacterized protein LOC128725103 [Anopheles nili]|uniref:uncharacterized protein LOC128725103 n=1 Tax=Anopheles nili TaxID=185578 RepID=UPI00237B6555|nr:uncharacterized protein LOC128725103 [Anopheles nili]
MAGIKCHNRIHFLELEYALSRQCTKVAYKRKNDTTFKDFPSPDIARSLTGPDILQKHSINSLLLEHNEIISRGLPSPIEDNMSLSDLLGGSQASSPISVSSSLVTSSSSSSGKSTSQHQNSSALAAATHHHHHLSTHHNHNELQPNQHHNHHQQNGPLATFSTLPSSLGVGVSGGVTNICDDSASSIFSSTGLSSGSGGSTASGTISSNPFNFASLRIPSPSLNSPDLLNSGGLIGGSIVGSSHSTASNSSSSSSSGISCGIGSGGNGQSPTTHSFYSSLQQQSAGSGGEGSAGSSGGGVGFDEFRFDTDLVLGCGSSGIVTPNGLTTETLKLRRRHISFDCTTPTTGTSSPGEGASPTLTLLCPNTSGRNYRNGSYSQLQQSTVAQQHNPQQQQQQSINVPYDILTGIGSANNGGTVISNNIAAMGGFDANSTNNSSLSLFTVGNGSLSRSHSPQDHTDTSNLLTNLENASILDMLKCFTLGQSTNSPTGQHNNQSQQQPYVQQNQFGPYTSSLGTMYQQQPQQTTGPVSTSFGTSTANSGTIASLSGLNSNNTGISSDYERLQNLQALNTLRLLQQSQQLSQLQQLQFNQSLLSATTGNTNGIYSGSVGAGNISPSGTNGPAASNIGSASSSAGGNCSNNNNSNAQTKNWSPQHQQQLLQLQMQQGFSTTSLNGGSNGGNGYADNNLDRIARFHRSSAAHYDATCTWSGVLPPRSNRLVTYSSKIFLGGMPWDISEQSLVQVFKPFGSIKVEWPGKEQQATQPKGYVYIIFESDKQVKALLQACTYTNPNGNIYGGNHGCASATATGAKINFKISSKRIKSKDVEVIPWNIADSNYVKSTSQKLDPTKTVFVGALHGQLTAEGLAKIMNDLFDGVVYVGIDTDKYKYPLGSARVTFNNCRSYMKAVVAAFIEIRTTKFTKKLQVDPYLEDSLCSMCTVQHGPYFCREIVCFRYFCRSCWQLQHSREVYLQNHKPLTRNSKFTAIIGVGPQQQVQSHTLGNNNGIHHPQQHTFDHNQYYNNHHNHHHHHEGSNRSLGHQTNSNLSSNNQYHKNGTPSHHNGHYHHQQHNHGRLTMLQQQYQRSLSKSPSPSISNGVESGSSNDINSSSGSSNISSSSSSSSSNSNNSNSCSPLGISNQQRNTNSAGSSCSNNSNTGNNSIGGESLLGSSCNGSLNMQQLGFIGNGGSVCGGSNGGSGLII